MLCRMDSGNESNPLAVRHDLNSRIAAGYANRNQIPVRQLSSAGNARNELIGNGTTLQPTQTNKTSPQPPYHATGQTRHSRLSAAWRAFVAGDGSSPSAQLRPSLV